MYYICLNEIPEQYKEMLQRLIEDGVIISSDKLEHILSDDMLFILKILARKGLL